MSTQMQIAMDVARIQKANETLNPLRDVIDIQANLWGKSDKFSDKMLCHFMGQIESKIIKARDANGCLTFGEIVCLLQNAQHYAEKTAR